MASVEKNDLTYFGVLMNRKLISTGIYLFKPEYLIEGTITQEEKNVYFTDTLENEYLTIHDTETLSTDEETAVGYIISDEDLTKKYPDLSIPEAKVAYFDEVRDMAHLGFYVFDEDLIAVMPVDLLTMSNTINSMKRNPDSNIIKIPSSTFVQPDMSGFDDTNNGLTNFEELKASEYVYITIDMFNDIYESKSFEEMKEKLNVIKSAYDSMHTLLVDENVDIEPPKSLNVEQFFERKVTGKHITDLFNASYDAFLAIDDIERLKETVKQIVDVYTDLSYVLDGKQNLGPHVDLAQDYLYSLIDKYEELLKLDNIDDIKKGITEIKNSQFKNISAISKTYDDLSKKNELVEVNIEHEKKQEEPESTINKKSITNSRFNYVNVYSQMIERIIGRDRQIGNILTAIDKMDASVGTNKKYSVLIAGTTGTGKTQTFNELKKAMPDRPIVIVDTNQLTQEGYIGGKIEKNVLGALLIEAHNINNKGKKDNGTITPADLELAETGIVVLDEIDKRAEKGDSSKDNVNCGAVVDQLLKFMDGTTYTAEVGKQSIPFDTSKVGVMASGAFQEYFDEKEKGEKCLGFTSQLKNEEDEFKKYNEVKPEDLVKYGLDNQFIGRFQSVILYPPHTLESLIELETTEATSNIEVEKAYFNSKGVELVYDEEFIETVAAAAIKLKTGGRGLSNIISRCLSNVGDEINRNPNVYKILYLPKEAVDDPGKVMLLKKKSGHILMEEVFRRNIEEGQGTRKLKRITFNKDALNEVMKYKNTLCKDESVGMELASDNQKLKQKGMN